MSAPNEPLGGLFGNRKTIYPPAPAGYKYADVNVPQAPPGYSVAKMSDIVRSGGGVAGGATGGTRQRDMFNTHTPEGIKERASEANRLQQKFQELRMLGNPNYKPRGGRFDSNATGVDPNKVINSPDLPAVLALLKRYEGGDPVLESSTLRAPENAVPIPAPGKMSQILAAQRKGNALGNDVQKALEKLRPILGQNTPSSAAPDSPGPMQSQPLPGLPAGDAPLSDDIQSKLEMRQPTSAAPSRSMMPEVLQEMWRNLTAPPGPAFDPSKVDLGLQKYDPLPETDEDGEK
jgi:hypothetical protein